MTFLFGYGMYHADSAYGDFILRIGRDYGFYSTDVGFIGQIYQNGIIFVLVTYWLCYKLYFKYKNQVPLYVKMMVLFCVPMSPMIFLITTPVTALLWIFMIYISDIHINRSPLELESTRNKKNI